jgi:cytochrome c553
MAAVFSFDSGKATLLCTKCHAVLKKRKELTKQERLAAQGEVYLESQYCNRCEEELVAVQV